MNDFQIQVLLIGNSILGCVVVLLIVSGIYAGSKFIRFLLNR